MSNSEQRPYLINAEETSVRAARLQPKCDLVTDGHGPVLMYTSPWPSIKPSAFANTFGRANQRVCSANQEMSAMAFAEYQFGRSWFEHSPHSPRGLSRSAGNVVSSASKPVSETS